MATAATTKATEGMSDTQIIRRYERLLAANGSPLACFVCGKIRRTVNALVTGPCDDSLGVATSLRPTLIGHGHGVCRPCIKRGEAVALR